MRIKTASNLSSLAPSRPASGVPGRRAREPEHNVATDRTRPATEILRKQREGQVAAFVGGLDRVLSDEVHRCETEDGRSEKENPSEEHHPNHGSARGLRVGHCVEARHHVGEPSKAKYVAKSERDLVERILQVVAGQQELPPVALFGASE